MDKNNFSLWLSIVATAISILTFFITSFVALWRSWRERARLRFGIANVIQNNTDGRKFNQVEIKLSNIGLRPMILTGFKAIAPNGSYHMGDTDPTAAAHGIAIDVFPAHLEPGKTIKFYPVSIGALIQNQTDPKDPTHHYSPWIYFVLIDSFNNYHHMYVQDVLWELHMLDMWKPRACKQKIADYFNRRRLFAGIKKQRF